MTKDRVLSELHALIDTRLFGNQWLVTHETAHVVDQKLTELGLSEKVPGSVGDSRNTALGKEVNLHLMMVFIGSWHQWEVINILEEYGFITSAEYDNLADRIAQNEEDENREPGCHGSDLDAAFLPFIRRAYFEYFNPSRLLN